MTEFFDTSVLVAAHLGDHPHHDRSLAALAAATKETSACAAHSLAEVYSVLTRLPVRPIILPEQAMLFLTDVRERLSIITLDDAAYFDAIQSSASRGITGVPIYDALLLHCAAQVDAETVLTWNVGHFQQIRPDLADRVRTP